MQTTAKFLYFLGVMLMLSACGGGSSGDSSGSAAAPEPLNDDQNYALAYMWHEEKLAHDLYLALYAEYPTVVQLYNIANNGESTHISMVENLVETYDINITNFDNNYTVSYSEEELRDMTPGTFAIPEVQDLYDDLFAKGRVSRTDALKVGCIVEVIDINDLNHYITVADDRQDLVSTFEYLRSGSYMHYNAFDSALKNDMNIPDGCCDTDVLQDLADSYGQATTCYQ